MGHVASVVPRIDEKRLQHCDGRKKMPLTLFAADARFSVSSMKRMLRDFARSETCCRHELEKSLTLLEFALIEFSSREVVRG